MRWLEESLNKKFAIGTAAGLLISSLVFLFLFVNLYREELAQERSSAAAQVTRMLQTSLENAMLKRDLDGLEDIVDRLGQETGILNVMITNPPGEIRFASDAGRLGQRIPSEEEALNGPVTRFIDDPDGRAVLRSINPVHNKPPCQECHGSTAQNPVNGVLYVDFDAGPLREQAWTTTLLLLGSGALIVLINLIGGWWFIRRYVIRPIEHLSEVSLRISEGELDARTAVSGRDELDARTAVSGRDELAALGDRFNRMAAGLQERLTELRDKEDFLHQLVNAIPDGIRVIERDYRVVLSNVTYREQLRLKPEESAPVFCYAATHGRDTPCPETLTTCPLKEIQKTRQPLRVVHRHQRSDGSTLDVELYAAPMLVTRKGETRLLIVESIRDLEQEVRFSHEQRLSELGRLAAGVAHEIHNPLAAIRLALHAAEGAISEESPEPDQAVEYLHQVDQEVERCSKVTEALLKLSVPPPKQQELVEVERVVGETLKLLQWEAQTRSVDIRLLAETRPLRILATDSDLRMVTLNLAQNACHAMPRGGILTVRCQREGQQVSIDFEDTGIGIDPRDQLRIFEPFFSRRADGIRGTGLGLSISKSIIEKHGGNVLVDSTPGHGSRVSVTFPDADLETEE